jgi:hypothetical protein
MGSKVLPAGSDSNSLFTIRGDGRESQEKTAAIDNTGAGAGSVPALPTFREGNSSLCNVNRTGKR